MKTHWHIGVVAGAILLLTGCATPRDRAAEGDEGNDLALAGEQARFADALAHYAQGLIYDLHYRADDAIPHYEQAAELDPAQTMLPLRVAREYQRRKEWDKAIAVLNQALAKNPKSYELLRELATTYEAADKTEEAIAAYGNAIATHPGKKEAYVELAVLYIRQDDEKKAFETLNKALSKVDDPIVTLKILGDLWIQKALASSDAEKADYFQHAIDIYERMARKAPEDKAVLFRLGELYLINHQMDKAIDAFQRVEAENPSYLLIRSIDRYAGGDKGKTIQFLEEALNSLPDDYAILLMLGGTYEETGDQEKAVAYFRRASQTHPPKVTPFLKLALLQMEADPAKALEILEEAVQLMPDEPDPYIYAGFVHNHAKQYKAAVAAFERAEPVVQRAEDADVETKAKFYFWYGAACERDGQIERAETLFERCLEIDPERDQAYNYLAYMWAERAENLDKALRYVRKALNKDPNNGAYIDTLGWIYYQRKEYEKAEKELERAHEIMPEDATVAEHLGDVLLILKGPAEAVRLWKRSLESDPANEGVQEKLKKHQTPPDAASSEREPDEPAPGPAPEGEPTEEPRQEADPAGQAQPGADLSEPPAPGPAPEEDWQVEGDEPEGDETDDPALTDDVPPAEGEGPPP
ncbi:MAG: tetratricopeptide repeat protein [Kiritimatiellae bacterium]|nr:tetratricopeptide repeat protein [Kiritimatiellia bacterium]